MIESNVGLEREPFESGKQFIVEEVRVDLDTLNYLLIVSHIGVSIE